MLKKDSEFIWDKNQDITFKAMNEYITNFKTLAYFVVSKEITLQVDASQRGLGATLLQEGKPVAYAPKSLTLKKAMLRLRNVCNRVWM